MDTRVYKYIHILYFYHDSLMEHSFFIFIYTFDEVKKKKRNDKISKLKFQIICLIFFLSAPLIPWSTYQACDKIEIGGR